jgi:tRNA U34 5-carboxymethylaminomethyl modifying enzyme MnmG/GidA
MQDGNPAGGSGNEPAKKEEPVLTQEEINSLKEKADKIAFYESEAKKAFKERDEAKSKLREIDDAELIKKGEYEKLLQDSKKEAETLKAELANAKEAETKYNAFVESTKKDLIESLPEEHKKIGEKLSLEDLKEYVKLNSTKTNYDKSRTGGMSFTTEGKNWTDFNSKELDEISKKNKDLFNKLYENYLKTKK